MSLHDICQKLIKATLKQEPPSTSSYTRKRLKLIIAVATIGINTVSITARLGKSAPMYNVIHRLSHWQGHTCVLYHSVMCVQVRFLL